MGKMTAQPVNSVSATTRLANFKEFPPQNWTHRGGSSNESENHNARNVFSMLNLSRDKRLRQR